LINVPLRYDLLNSTSVNSSISILNRKLKKIVKVLPHTSFLETDNNRNSFTNHELNLNKPSKRLVTYQLASLLQSIFEQKPSFPIILGCQNEIRDNNIPICEGNQVKLSTRNSSRNKKKHQLLDQMNFMADLNANQSAVNNTNIDKRYISRITPQYFKPINDTV
jgi:hypothetical protein